MTKRCILALDQGTTGNTALILDDQGNILGKKNREFPQHFPKPGLVEHNPDDIWNGMLATIADALDAAGVAGQDIAAIGITNQRETTVLWDAETSQPVANALVWQDRRTADRCEQLRNGGHADAIRAKTGLVIDPYFSATKLEWLLNQHDPERQRASRLRFGTIDTFLVWKLTGGAVHATEPSNASRTMLFNIHDGRWDPDLLSLFGVPESILPEVRPSAGHFGETRGLELLPDGIPIAGIAGDQQAALFGQACFEPGQSKCTYGTGAFLLLNTGQAAPLSRHGVLTTIAWQLPDEPLCYALEGSVFVAGSAVQWLRDGLGLINSAPEIEELAASVPDSGGVTFVPALTGLGAPHWRAEARGLISGLTRGTTRAHIARATLEGIALQIVELIEAMNADAPEPLRELRVDGGATANDLLMQIQADLARTTIVRPANIETTAFGAGFLAGLGAGIWPDRQRIIDVWREDRRFAPAAAEEQVNAIRERWREAEQKA
ncbi:MAG: glycerol kinase [Candidatus Dadabacteria bacterium]|nr:MAG: glycerol kinase [Candidatus Dadabacteria bacterium]